MKILVTGGLGTVGQPLVKALRSRGYVVYVCDLYHHHDSRYYRCDISSYRQLLSMFKELLLCEVDIVYHLAAEFGRWNGEDYYENLWRTNAVGTKNLIRLQEQRQFKMVYFSSSEVYGDYPGVMEESVMDREPIKQLNDYAMTKWIGEMQCLNSAEQHGTQTVRVRLFNTYGPGEYYSPYRSVACRFIYYALMDLPYTVYLGHHRTSTFVSDTVRTLANIPERFTPGAVYNIAGDQYHDIKELSDLVLRAAGKDDRSVTYEESEPLTTRDKKVSAERAVRDLDHRCSVPLEVGIERTTEWMRKVYLED